MLAEIQATLKEKEASGELAKLQREAVDKAKERIVTPTAVAGVKRATSRRRFLFDPSIRLEEDIVDQNGNLVAAAGTLINPLDYTPFQRVMLFLDGRDDDQVERAEALLASESATPTLVLTGGSPMALMKRWERRVYFDQGGLLTKKFGITQVPATVRRDGNRLAVEEFPPK